jgi:hypothetical protein
LSELGKSILFTSKESSKEEIKSESKKKEVVPLKFDGRHIFINRVKHYSATTSNMLSFK